jgi:hypothetical protein
MTLPTGPDREATGRGTSFLYAPPGPFVASVRE